MKDIEKSVLESAKLKPEWTKLKSGQAIKLNINGVNSYGFVSSNIDKGVIIDDVSGLMKED